MPPLAIEATRCSTSSGICAAWAAAIKLSDIAASAMLMPPEADPVMPANRVTLIASFSSGLGIADSACDSTKKPGSAAITAPKPYSEAVFIAARIAPPTAVLLPSASRPRILRKPNTTTSRIPDTSAASTAQMAVIFATSVVIGLASPGSVSSWLAPYHCGIQWVKPRLNTPTKINGRIAISGFGRLMSSGVSGSFSRSVPYPSPFSCALRRWRSRYSRPTAMMNSEPISPSQGAAQALVPKKLVGMMFWICGVPGKASMVKEKAPSATVAGISRLGIPLWRNSSAANG